MKTIEKEKLKAYFSSQLFINGDCYGPNWSEWTSGDVEGFTLERIHMLIDRFDESKI